MQSSMTIKHWMLGLALGSSLVAAPVLAAPAIPSQQAVLLIAAVGKPNPAKMNFEHYYDIAAPLGTAAGLITDSAPAAHRRVRYGDITLKRGIMEAAEANLIDPKAEVLEVDTAGFAKSFATFLKREKNTLLPFAATGWGVSEKDASKQLDALIRNPDQAGIADSIIAILIGLLTEAEALKMSADVIDAQQAAAEAGSLGFEVHTIGH